MKKIIMEFIGTFFFVLTIVMTANPIAIASMLMAWVYIGGYVSGGYYNPAVTLAVAISHKWDWMEASKYMIAQVLGALAACIMAVFFLGKSAALVVPLAKNATLAQIFVMELLLTFVLAYIVLVVTSHKFKESKIFGAAIGFTIPALAAWGKPISGGIFNPALILGTLFAGIILGGNLSWAATILAVYIGAQLLGGVLAAYMFKHLNFGNLEHH